MQSQFIIVVLDVLSVLSRGRARASGQATQERKRKVEAVMHQRTMSYVLHESECGSMAGQHERRKRKVEHVMHQRQCRRSCTTANHLGDFLFRGDRSHVLPAYNLPGMFLSGRPHGSYTKDLLLYVSYFLMSFYPACIYIK